MRNDNYCLNYGHEPHVNTGVCIYCGKKVKGLRPWQESVIFLLFIIAITCAVVALASPKPAPVLPEKWVVGVRFYDKLTGEPSSRPFELGVEFPNLKQCNDFLISTGPQKGTEHSFVVMWCEKIGPRETET